jgi:DNA-binding NarL/FixJ family response regulator
VILDVTLPDGDGVSFAREILEKLPECRIYILTMHRRSGLLLQAKKTGCRGYFLKEGDGSAVVEALKSGSSRFSVSPQLEDMLMSLDDESDTVRRYSELTRREKEVFRLFAEGLGYKEVAWSLGISPRTASVHRYNIFNKLEITGDVELVKAAQEVGLSV